MRPRRIAAENCLLLNAIVRPRNSFNEAAANRRGKLIMFVDDTGMIDGLQ